ncbi:MAG: substrate-binding domain-containing protein [Nitrospinota bacterium]
MAERKRRKGREIDRRTFLKASGAVGTAALGGLSIPPFLTYAAGDTVESRAVEAGKALAKGRSIDLTFMIWSAYGRGQITKLAKKYKGLTGIGIAKAIDVNVFVMPPRAMQEAVAKTGKIDVFHLGGEMIPSLANAGLARPLDRLMEKGGHKIETVGPAANIMKYRGQQYGLLTDGNVHVTFMRKDVIDKRAKEYEDKFGKSWSWPQTWKDYNAQMKFFGTTPNLVKSTEPFYGSGNLRARRTGGPYWWFMIYYSKGGFPFTDEAEPNLDTDAAVEATEEYLATKESSPPEITDWGSPQMIPYYSSGHVFSVTYWDGGYQAAEGAKSATRGKWVIGQVPGSMQGGTLVKRSITSLPSSFIINRHSKKAEAAYWLCQYLTGPENSTRIVGDSENVFHDPWHPRHFKDPAVIKAYTPEGMKAIRQNLQVTTVSLLVTGGPLQFFDHLDKNLAEAMLGKHNAKQAMKKTQETWARVVRKIGKKIIKADLQGYRDAISKINVPT